MNDKRHAEDLKAMIAADKGHLDRAVERGDRVHAKGFLDSIVDNQRALEDLGRTQH